MTKIMLVEDDKSLREIYGVRLEAEDYQVVSAGDGEEALALAIKERPALIISDVMMPKISGFDMLDILRSTTETKDIKVIMMTALSSDDQRARGEALGADRYLVKSQVGIEDVIRTVHEVLGDGVPTAAPAPSFPPATPAPAQPAPEQAPAAAPATPVINLPSEPAPATPPQATPAAPETPSPAPSPEPTPAAAPTLPQPTTEPAPQPAPTAQPASESGLPAPTAPFSTDRPASLGDRVVTPLPSADNLAGSGNTDIASQMNAELNSANSAQQPPAPAPAPQPAPEPAPQPQPAPPAQPEQQQQPPTPPAPTA